MIEKVLSVFGICRHNRITWPTGKGGHVTVTCLSCTRTLEYSMSDMCITGEVKPQVGRKWDEKREAEA